jgi:hypothetical protein
MRALALVHSSAVAVRSAEAQHDVGARSEVECEAGEVEPTDRATRSVVARSLQFIGTMPAIRELRPDANEPFDPSPDPTPEGDRPPDPRDPVRRAPSRDPDLPPDEREPPVDLPGEPPTGEIHTEP